MKDNYVDEDDPWLGVLAKTAFEIRSTGNSLNGYSPGQLLFGHDIFFLIKIRWNGNKYVS